MIWIQTAIMVATFLTSILVVKKVAAAWVISAVLEIVWVGYYVATRQWPFIVSAMFFLGRDIWAWAQWRHAERPDLEVQIRPLRASDG